MTLEEFVSRLDRAKRSNGGYAARCPAHEDKRSSLSVAEKDGKLLVKCHATCSTEAVVRALGLEMSDLFEEDLRGRRGSWEERIDRTYDYVDEVGTLLFQSVRLRDPKDFRQRRPKPSGKGWEWKLDDVRRVPYRLPELLRAMEEGRSVWVVEGEKDADALVEIGLPATSNPMGAGSWLDEYALLFRGAPWVMIVSDCDEAGRKHSATVAHSLHAAGIRSKVIDLAPARDDGYDVSDYLAEHGDDSEYLLRDLAREAKRWRPGASTGSGREGLRILGLGEFLSSVPEYDESRDYLGPFLHGGYRIHVAGPIGHGKTSFLMEAVSAAVRGDEFLGWRGRGDLRALYVDLEMPTELLGQALRDARLEGAEGFDVLHLPDGLEIDVSPQHRRLLEQAVEGYDVVVVDPWYKLFANELEYASARNVISLFDGIRARHPDLCLLVGFHAQEPNSPKAPVTLGSTSGFKFFQRPADVVLTFQRIGGNSSRIRWEKNRSPRLDVKKGETWSVEWERGGGFSRRERKTAKTRILEILDEEFFLPTADVAEELGQEVRAVRRALADLDLAGLVERRGGEKGRGHSAEWRRRTEAERRAAA